MTRPRTIVQISTPALLVDVPAMERNIRRMAQFFAEGPCKLRPHFKAHKTPEIARRQLAAGSCTGLTCATVAEAEVAADFCDDILIANEVLGPGKAPRVAALAGRIDVTVAVDSQTALQDMAAAAGDAGVEVGALAVPVDPREHRRLLEEAGFVSVQVETGDVSVRQDMLEQLQIDGFRALKPFFASIFDREMRNSVHKRVMREAQRTFEAHTGYGLYFARKPAAGSTKP